VQRNIAENFILGVDLGIASVGWALLDDSNKIIAGCGSRTFDAPEIADKGNKVPKNQKRRDARLLRRVIRRRSQRLTKIRRLCDDQLGTCKTTQIYDPWKLRSEGLDRLLIADELRCILIHIAKHRGFQCERPPAESRWLPVTAKSRIGPPFGGLGAPNKLGPLTPPCRKIRRNKRSITKKLSS